MNPYSYVNIYELETARKNNGTQDRHMRSCKPSKMLSEAPLDRHILRVF